jgi:uncharacterized protein YcbK (DUF882 family)
MYFLSQLMQPKERVRIQLCLMLSNISNVSVALLKKDIRNEAHKRYSPILADLLDHLTLPVKSNCEIMICSGQRGPNKSFELNDLSHIKKIS